MEEARVAERTNPVVAAMMAGAISSARDFARAQARFADRLKRENMQVIVDDFAERLAERDQTRLDAASIRAERLDDGRLVFVSPAREAAFEVRVRNARELLAGGRIVPVKDLAVLDRDLYVDLVNRLLDWFGGGPARQNGGAWGR